MIKKLERMPYAQAKVIVGEKLKTLVSYQTAVATITSEGWLTVNGLYSMTTRRHISAFVKEYAPAITSFETIKFLARTGMKMNIHTGEVLPQV